MRHPEDSPATAVVVDDVIVARLDARAPGLSLVDALARLQLDVRRRGGAMRLRDAPEELGGLLDLLGLAGVIRVEPRRQAERGEQVGGEEVVQPRDPPL
jgi:hypothetical protein